MMLSKVRFAVLVTSIATGSFVAACESSSNSESTTIDAGSGFDAGFADSSNPFDAAVVDSSPTTPPFEGVWQGTQGPATVEVSNADGCSRITGSVDGTICDECLGTYTVGDAGVARAVVTCKPLGPCSISPAHTNTGTFTKGDGGALTYLYDYGGGTATVVVEPTPRAPGNVCQIVDAGTD